MTDHENCVTWRCFSNISETYLLLLFFFGLFVAFVAFSRVLCVCIVFLASDDNFLLCVFVFLHICRLFLRPTSFLWTLFFLLQMTTPLSLQCFQILSLTNLTIPLLFPTEEKIIIFVGNCADVYSSQEFSFHLPIHSLFKKGNSISMNNL